MSGYWYKDRDFTEVKASNSDIVAVIENLDQLQRVIEEHNTLVEALAYYASPDVYEDRMQLSGPMGPGVLVDAGHKARVALGQKD